jgi:photoactive yellow protein
VKGLTEMSDDVHALAFELPDLFNALETLDDQQLDGLAFGVIGFSRDGLVRRYNRFETEATGLNQDYVLGKHVFTQIAQCMNNFLVAQRYEDAWANECPLDATIDYVLTWRMRPTSVKLRMLLGDHSDIAYVVLSPRRALGT